MLTHPFSWLMIATFIGAVLAMLAGVAGLGKAEDTARAHRSNQLMALRVALCALLLAEILIYITFIR